jgi:hypothetical protein
MDKKAIAQQIAIHLIENTNFCQIVNDQKKPVDFIQKTANYICEFMRLSDKEISEINSEQEDEEKNNESGS